MLNLFPWPDFIVGPILREIFGPGDDTGEPTENETPQG